MKLFLLRHAHTEKAKGNTSDFDREIDELGFEQLERLKDFLSKEYTDLSFDVLCSPSSRTKTTYEEIKTAINVVHEEFAHELYLPSRDNLLHYLWKRKNNSENALIISHNNGISDLASYLLEEPTIMPTCTFLEINMEGVDNLNELSKGLGVVNNTFIP